MVVAVGASAGGLDACRKLLGALPPHPGAAFIIIQHLDPTHDSLLVELLASHTEMTVLQAADGMRVEPDQVYVIPPGAYLAVHEGALRLSQPGARHGARLPFDFLLHSLAEQYGPRAVCIVMSGTGADGSQGLRAIKAAGGLVIAESPQEADYDGMPRSAIETGDVDLVLGIQDMPAALVARARHEPLSKSAAAAPPPADRNFAAIIDLLRTTTAHDFSLYKQGTLERRIGRRMAMASIGEGDMGGYLARLRQDRQELNLLANDLLINVTSFFRDPTVFDYLAAETIPALVRAHRPDQPIRIWVAGCSTGEETYTLAMLFREAIAAARLDIRLQIFASDTDADAVATGRDGLYPVSIERDVTPARLARYFLREDFGYRASAELRSAIVFTVQDVLTDPPFSRIDMISCRNLLIYLRPEAQARVISMFHFSLRQGGLLLLGGSETMGDFAGRFEIVSKSARLFRHIGRARPGEMGFAMSTGDGMRVSLRAGGQAPARQATVADLCRRLVLENYAPAAVLINQRNECLFTLGPLDRYLRVASGHPTHDLLAMARPALRTRLRAAIQQAWQSDARVTAPGGQVAHDDDRVKFRLDVHPVTHDSTRLLLVCFVDGTGAGPEAQRPGNENAAPVGVENDNAADLRRELEATRAELRAAIRNLELSGEEQTAINEEALSVNEEFQSTNEELLTSKEELQSLNEELTALNSQLQETLERQRTTANDMQNVLYSTDVATLFLDTALKIRFFTPATKSLFSVIPTDVGRPLSDLTSLAADGMLLDDARTVMATRVPQEREIEARNGHWYLRRILPYRTQNDGIEGVVITFVDITERRRAAEALEAARREAEAANVAKSRFLAAASHDLRQPVQALALLQGLLAKTVQGDAAKRLVALLDPTLSAMTTMLNTLLDINQIDAGTVQPHIVDFPVGPLLARLHEEFGVIASAYGLKLRLVPCGHVVRTDPHLLEQMLRNLLSNAVKYTKHGRVLLGCRHRGGVLVIQVCDTGIGIPPGELDSIFDEYHQVDNAARERSRGLGLGLSIVKRLGDLLGHRVTVRSRKGVGSTFSIEADMPHEPGPKPATGTSGGVPPDITGGTPPDIAGGTRSGVINDAAAVTALAPAPLPAPRFAPMPESMSAPMPESMSAPMPESMSAPMPESMSAPMPESMSAPMPESMSAPMPATGATRPAAILLVEDDPDIRDLLTLVLEAQGHAVTVAVDGVEALSLAARGRIRPDLVLADYNLPLQMNGLQLAAKLRERLHHQVPVIILTGDISTETLRDIAAQACAQLIKPVRPEELAELIARLVPPVSSGPDVPEPVPPAVVPETVAGPPIIYVVDDDRGVRESIRRVLQDSGHLVEAFASCEAFLQGYKPGREACLLLDACLPGMQGIDLLRRLQDAGQKLPSIMITGAGDVSMAVEAMKAGAMDLIEKPVSGRDLLDSVSRALEISHDSGKLTAIRHDASSHLAGLTRRQRQVLDMVLAGFASKNIAAALGISQRTVENHRASIMHRTGVRSMPALARLAMTAAWHGGDPGQ